jgi:hypothetical protein
VFQEFRVAVAHAERAIAMAKELGLPEPARALGFRGAARTDLGDARGIEDMRQAMEAATAQGLAREIAILHMNLAEALWPIEGPRARLETLREGSAFSEHRGIEEFVLGTAGEMVSTLVELGFYHDAEAMARDLVPRLEGAKDMLGLLTVRSALVRILGSRGELTAAASLADWAIERAKEFPDPQYLAQALPPAAAVRLGMGDPPGAAALLSDLAGTPNVRDSPHFLAALPQAVRTAIGAGDPDLAERLGEGVGPRYPMHEHVLVTVRGLLAEHRGEHAGAVDLLADAAERWERFEIPWERAQALLGQGRCLLVLSRVSEATVALRQAREIFATLDAKPSLAETDALLVRATALTS